MKRYLQAIALLLIAAAAVLIPMRLASAHYASIACVHEGPHTGEVLFSASGYTNGGTYTVNGSKGVPFTDSFSIYLPGNIKERGVITAPDWGTFDETAGPCIEGGTTTTSVRSTTSTSTSTSTTSTTPSSSSTSAPTTTVPSSSTSTTPGTTAPSSTSSAPSTTVAHGSTIPASTSTVANGATTTSTSPKVAALPVTGSSSGTITLAAACFIGVGGATFAATRRRRPR